MKQHRHFPLMPAGAPALTGAGDAQDLGSPAAWIHRRSHPAAPARVSTSASSAA
ncbi:MAG TPA: hypothetical protein VGH81_14735 [Rudaea sp.]